MNFESEKQDGQQIMGVLVEPRELDFSQSNRLHDLYMESAYPAFLTEEPRKYAQGRFAILDYEIFDEYVESIDPDEVVLGGRLENIAEAREEIDHDKFKIDDLSVQGEVEVPGYREIFLEQVASKIPFHDLEDTGVKYRDSDEALEEYGLEDIEIFDSERLRDTEI